MLIQFLPSLPRSGFTFTYRQNFYVIAVIKPRHKRKEMVMIRFCRFMSEVRHLNENLFLVVITIY